MPNGLVTYTGTLRNALRAAGSRVFVLSLDLYDPPESYGAEEDIVHVRFREGARAPGARLLRLAGIDLPGLRDERAIASALLTELGRLHEESGLELFQMEESFGWARRVVPRSPVPVVTRLAGPWFLTGSGGRRKVYDRLRIRREGQAFRRSRALLAPSCDVLERVTQRYGPGLPPSTVIPNPVPLPPIEATWRSEAVDRELVLFVGRFDRIKGVDLILRAFALVVAARPTARLLCVGPDPGYADDHGHRWSFPELLEQEVPRSDQRARVERCGRQPRDRLDAYRRQAAVIVVPSRYETFCHALVEAMSLGAPVVAARTGGMADIVQHETNGLLFDSEDIHGLADAILRLLGDRALAARLGRSARTTCAERFAPGRVARHVLDFYDSVITR